MLKLAENKDIDAIRDICGGDLTGTRIVCYAEAYGFERDFLQIWFDEENKVVVAKFYDSITLAGDSVSSDEISDFIRMVGFKNMELTYDNCEKLGFKADCVKKAYVFSGASQNCGAENLGEEYYKSLYSLVCENIPGAFKNSEEAYLSFLSDFTFRKKRGLARCKGIISDGKLVSSVITSAETADCALLSAVSSEKRFRGQGLGRNTVLSITDELVKENKKVFVVALNESAQGFYEHIGFEFYDKIATVLG